MENPIHKEMIEEIKAEWKRMWWERIDDKVKAEGIANEDFSLLFVEQGTVVFATRSFRPPDLREIIEQHRIPDADRIVPPNPAVGGWGKFIKETLVHQRPRRKNRSHRQYCAPEKQRQQLKKGGRGWLHNWKNGPNLGSTTRARL